MKCKTTLIVPKLLKKKLIDFSENTGLSFFKSNPAGNNRRFCNLNNVDLELSKEIKIFSKQCYNSLGINEVIEEHLFGNFIGINTEGGFVHEHKDPVDSNGRWHVRLNFMLQKPLDGGDVIINGTKIYLNEDDSWLNFASIQLHGSTPVKGIKNRIVLSLGNYIDEIQATKIYNKIII